MTASTEVSGQGRKTLERADEALRFPVGAASPLWLFYAGAAGAGVAYWLMTRWASPMNLESMMGKKAAAALAPMAEAASAALEAAEDVLVETVAEVEAAVEVSLEAIEAAVEVSQSAVTEALETTPADVAPVARSARRPKAANGASRAGARAD